MAGLELFDFDKNKLQEMEVIGEWYNGGYQGERGEIYRNIEEGTTLYYIHYTSWGTCPHCGGEEEDNDQFWVYDNKEEALDFLYCHKIGITVPDEIKNR